MQTFEDAKVEARAAHQELQRQIRMLHDAVLRAENAGLTCVLNISTTNGHEPMQTRILLSKEVKFALAESRLVHAYDFARET